MLGAELRACGVDFSFTPVLDLDHGPSGVIGDRAFHRDPRIATLLAKGGAEGLQLVGLTDRAVGLALKCEDGAMRAVAPATMAVLEMLGVLTEEEKRSLAAYRSPVVTNAAGLEVGLLEAELRVGAHA